jgi:hypothetical protein
MLIGGVSDSSGRGRQGRKSALDFTNSLGNHGFEKLKDETPCQKCWEASREGIGMWCV